VNSVRFAGASDAEPAPGVIEAIEAADAILIAPSNPVTSIGPILAVPGIREALCRAKGKIGAISPIISGAPVNGPAGILMVAQGLPSSIAGVAQAYKDFLDVLICDTRDARPAEVLRKTGVRVQCAHSIMRTPEDKAELARKALALVSAAPVSEPGAVVQTSSSQAAFAQASSGQSSSDEAAADEVAFDKASSEQTPAEQAPAERVTASRPFVRFRPVDDPS